MRSAAPRSFLIIQTAFTGDVILATALIEKLHQQFPEAVIDFLLRKGNETLLTGHPFLRDVLIWDKTKSKIWHLVQIIRRVRGLRYDEVINVHRFASSGLVTLFSRAKFTVGFDKNPVSFLFDKRVKHVQEGEHEIARNQKLIEEITDKHPVRPRLYPSASDYAAARSRHSPGSFPQKYICIAPASVWFTKQFPKEKWVEFINKLGKDLFYVFLLGSPADSGVCEFIRAASGYPHISNLAGQLSFLESAALMTGAAMNYVNDSAPMHLASAMNAPVAAIFCSTVPLFGFGPLSDEKHVIETKESLDCRPCGLHGFKTCPRGHFKCALTITPEQLATVLKT